MQEVPVGSAPMEVPDGAFFDLVLNTGFRTDDASKYEVVAYPTVYGSGEVGLVGYEFAKTSARDTSGIFESCGYFEAIKIVPMRCRDNELPRRDMSRSVEYVSKFGGNVRITIDTSCVADFEIAAQRLHRFEEDYAKCMQKIIERERSITPDMIGPNAQGGYRQRELEILASDRRTAAQEENTRIFRPSIKVTISCPRSGLFDKGFQISREFSSVEKAIDALRSAEVRPTARRRAFSLWAAP